MKNNTIVHVVQHLLPGGIETMVLDFKRCSPNDKISVISLEGTEQSSMNSWDILASIPDLYFLNKKTGIDFFVVFNMIKLLKKLQAKVIHTHHVGPLIYGGIAAKIANCKHIHTEHDAWHLENKKRSKLVARCIKYFNPTVVADANIVAKNITKHIPICNPQVIINGVDADKFIITDKTKARNLLCLPQNSIIIGCAARFTTVKCHSLLLEAFAELPDNIILALAGDGELKQQLKQQSIELDIASRVYFLGVVKDMPAFYNAIDVFCLASAMEGLPLSLLEAQSCGVPVIATNVGGCSEIVDKKTGILIEKYNKKQLSDAMLTKVNSLLNNNEQQRLRNLIKSNCSLIDVIKKYNKLYQGVD
jgi:glycosyltransferase involved in cell wall biosynthesis